MKIDIKISYIEGKNIPILQQFLDTILVKKMNRVQKQIVAEVRKKTLGGNLANTTNRPQGVKSNTYKKQFTSSLKTSHSRTSSDIIARHFIKGADITTGLISPTSRNAYLNKLISSSTQYAKKGSTLRVPSELTSKHHEVLTPNSKRLKKVKKGKKYLIIRPSSIKNKNSYIAKKYGLINDIMFFKRTAKALIPIGRAYTKAAYGDVKRYKLPYIQSVTLKYKTYLEKYINAEISRISGIK